MYAERLCMRLHTAYLTTSRWVTDRFSFHIHIWLFSTGCFQIWITDRFSLHIHIWLFPTGCTFISFSSIATLSTSSLTGFLWITISLSQCSGFWRWPLLQAGKVERETRKWSRTRRRSRKQMKTNIVIFDFHPFLTFWHQQRSKSKAKERIEMKILIILIRKD